MERDIHSLCLLTKYVKQVISVECSNSVKRKEEGVPVNRKLILYKMSP